MSDSLKLFETTYIESFPCRSVGKEFACNGGDLGSIPGSGSFHWRRKWQPTPVLLLGESHEQRGQATNYGITRVDTTERLSAHTQRDMYTTYIDINLLNLGINTKGHISNLLKYVFCVHTEISTHIYRER